MLDETAPVVTGKLLVPIPVTPAPVVLATCESAPTVSFVPVFVVALVIAPDAAAALSAVKVSRLTAGKLADWLTTKSVSKVAPVGAFLVMFYPPFS